jgi:hypothetical protein
MTIEDILHHTEPGDELTVDNEPFSYKSKIVVTLDGGDIVHWLYSEDDNILSISPVADEILFFRFLDEDVEPDEDGVFIGGIAYESSYEDNGVGTEVVGEVNAEEEDKFQFREYESENGERVRLLTNESNGEVLAYIGKLLVDDDVAKL